MRIEPTAVHAAAAAATEDVDDDWISNCQDKKKLIQTMLKVVARVNELEENDGGNDDGDNRGDSGGNDDAPSGDGESDCGSLNIGAIADGRSAAP